MPIAKRIKSLGFNIYSTEGTAKFLNKNSIDAKVLKKLHEGRPNIADAIKNQEIHLIVNTPVGKTGKHDDSYIRMKAIQHRIPYITSLAAAEATAEGIDAAKNSKIFPKSLQDYYKELKGHKQATHF